MPRSQKNKKLYVDDLLYRPHKIQESGSSIIERLVNEQKQQKILVKKERQKVKNKEREATDMINVRVVVHHSNKTFTRLEETWNNGHMDRILNRPIMRAHPDVYSKKPFLIINGQNGKKLMQRDVNHRLNQTQTTEMFFRQANVGGIQTFTEDFQMTRKKASKSAIVKNITKLLHEAKRFNSDAYKLVIFNIQYIKSTTTQQDIH